MALVVVGTLRSRALPDRSTVDVPAPALLASADAVVCADLVQALPDDLGPGLSRRSVRDRTRTAAWGDPAVTLACGSAPAGQPGVDGEPFCVGPPGSAPLPFLQDDVGAAQLFTTRDRRVPVALQVPDGVDAQVLVPVTALLARLDPPAGAGFDAASC